MDGVREMLRNQMKVVSDGLLFFRKIYSGLAEFWTLIVVDRKHSNSLILSLWFLTSSGKQERFSLLLLFIIICSMRKTEDNPTIPVQETIFLFL